MPKIASSEILATLKDISAGTQRTLHIIVIEP